MSGTGLELLSIDFVKGLPQLEGKNCVLVDRFTKFAHFIGLSHPFTAQEVAQIFLDQIISLHWVLRTIVLDRDKICSSLMWQELFKSLGVRLHMSTAYYPETDGQTERVNQCLKNYLCCLCLAHPCQWHKWLSLVQWWNNSCYHTSIKMSPFQALYGYKPSYLPATMSSSSVAAVDKFLQQQQ